MAQVIVYAGAIMVLFLFVVMLLNAPQEDAAGWDRTHPLRNSAVGRFGAMLAALLIVELAWALVRANGVGAAGGAGGGGGGVSAVRPGRRGLFTGHMVAFGGA